MESSWHGIFDIVMDIYDVIKSKLKVESGYIFSGNFSFSTLCCIFNVCVHLHDMVLNFSGLKPVYFFSQFHQTEVEWQPSHSLFRTILFYLCTLHLF